MVIDSELTKLKNLCAGANEKNYHIKNVNYGRDYKGDIIADIKTLKANDPCPKCGAPVKHARGIEVGQVFKLGTKYSDSMGAVYKDENQKDKPIVMGSYGIGVSRTLAAIIEQNHDENGIIWPMPVAPYEVMITVVKVKDDVQMELAEKMYDELVEAEAGSVELGKEINLGSENLPSTFSSFLPIVLPVILILMNTVFTAMKLMDGFFHILIFLGQPIVAVGIGLLTAIFILGKNMSRKDILASMEKGMMSAGIIMLVTGGGGALGQIIKDSGLGTYMAEGITAMNVPIILLPLVISTVMRFIQGSGTVAMTTAASISAPIILATGANPVVSALACCVGSCFFSYFNDSYFWVVNRTLGVSEAKDQIRVWSITTTIIWAVGCIEVIILSFILH